MPVDERGPGEPRDRNDRADHDDACELPAAVELLNSEIVGSREPDLVWQPEQVRARENQRERCEQNAQPTGLHDLYPTRVAISGNDNPPRKKIRRHVRKAMQ